MKKRGVSNKKIQSRIGYELSLFHGFAVMCSMSHNQIEGDEAGNEGKSADYDQTELMECESAVPQVNLMDYSREMIRLAIALF
jgi:hypothetical protein